MRILYTNAEGGTSIVTPVEGAGLTLQEVIERSVPPGTSYIVVNDDDVPTDRTYRNAWTVNLANGSIGHDMVKARNIHRNVMRKARKPILEDLDVRYMRADERRAAGLAGKASIATQRQALRDVTTDPAIEGASTVDQLKRVWPVALGENPLVS